MTFYLPSWLIVQNFDSHFIHLDLSKDGPEPVVVVVDVVVDTLDQFSHEKLCGSIHILIEISATRRIMNMTARILPKFI